MNFDHHSASTRISLKFLEPFHSSLIGSSAEQNFGERLSGLITEMSGNSVGFKKSDAFPKLGIFCSTNLDA